MTRMNMSLAIQITAQRMAMAEIKAHHRRHGIKDSATPAQLKAQAQEWIEAHPEIVETARIESVRILTELRTQSPRRWAQFKDI